MSVSKEEQELLKIISNNIQNIRFNSGKTQQEMANILKMDRGNYTKIENGDTTRKLKFSQLVTLSKKLNVSLDYIFGLIGEDSPNVTIKEIYKEYGLTEQSLNIIKSTLYCDCSDIFNDFLYDFAVLDLTCKLKVLLTMNKMIKEDLIFLFQLSFFKEYVSNNKRNDEEIMDFLKIFENKIINIKKYNGLSIKKGNSLKIYSFAWSGSLPTLQKEESTIIELFEEIKKSIKNKLDENAVIQKINAFTSYVGDVLRDFQSKRELMKYHLIKRISYDLDIFIPEDKEALYYKELENYYPFNSYFTQEELEKIKKEHSKEARIIDTGLIKL